MGSIPFKRRASISRLFAGLLFVACGLAEAQTTTLPSEGIAQRTPRVIALTHARLVVKPGQVVEDGTLVLRDGRIVAVAAKANIPPDAAIVDLEGRTIYAGFIDALSDYAQVKEPDDAPAVSGRGPYVASPQQGSRHWNRRVRPENDLVEMLKPDPVAATALRKRGFTAVLSAPGKGILRGQSALVSTADSIRLNDVLIQPQVAQHVAFEQGSGPSDEYPTSLMGSIALIRQTLYDATWQRDRIEWQARKKGSTSVEANLALDALVPMIKGRQPAIFATSDELDFGRAVALADEFGIKLVLAGNGREYRRAAELKAAGVPLILPLTFVEAPSIEDPDRALDVSLADLEHWEWSSYNARVLAESRVPFAFTATGLKKPEEQFWVNLRKSVENGLDEDLALAALTVQPAMMLGVGDRLGTLEVGRLAQFVVADADLFRSADARIYETWVDGRRYPIDAAGTNDPRGAWTLTWSGAQGPTSLRIAGELKALKASVGETAFPVSLGDGELSLYPPGKLIGSHAERVVVLAALERRQLRGRVALDDGREIRVEGRLDKPEPRSMAAVKVRPALPATTLRYPAGEFGIVREPAQASTLVVRHATVWTQGPQGTLSDTDVLIEKGRIVAIGKALKAPSNALEIDAQGKHLAPGIIDAHSHMAISRGVNEISHSVTSEVRIGDVLDPTDMTIYRQLAGGVTSAQLLHGSANAIGGQAQTIKLRWGSDAEGLRFAGAPPTIKFALGENVKQSNWGEAFNKRYPQTRMGVQEIILDSFLAAEDYAARLKLKGGEPQRRDLRLEALAEILAGKRFVHIHSYRQDEILGFVRLSERFRIVPTFQHVLEGYKVADELAKLGAGASTFSDWWAYKMEVADAIPYNPALMDRQGVVVSLNSDSDELGRRLNTEAAKTVKYGALDEIAALNMVTLNPARQLHIERSVGSLEVGKDADFVIWNASPLSTLAYPEQTWIDGRKYFDRADDLAERVRIGRERERLIAKILPERVKALAAKDGKPDKQESSAGPVLSQTVEDDDYRHYSALRPPYHNSEPVHVCKGDH